MPVTRETLYDEIWAEPMTTVASRYGVSSSFLARVCARLNVPRPPRGYWALKRCGDTPKRPRLPKAGPCDELEWVREGESRTVARALPEPPASTGRRVRKRRDRPDWHPLVAEARDLYKSAKENHEGYLIPAKRNGIDLYVSPATLENALSVANSLFLGLEDRGYVVTFPPRHLWLERVALDERVGGGHQRFSSSDGSATNRATVVFIGTVAVALTLFEPSKSREVGYLDGKYVPVEDAWMLPKRRGRFGSPFAWTSERHLPTGTLCIRATSPYPNVNWELRWPESRPGALASKVNSIIRSLESEVPLLAKCIAEEMERAESKRKAEQAAYERWKQEEEYRRQQESRKRSRKNLQEIIDAWSEAKRVQAFFAELEKGLESLDDEQRTIMQARIIQSRDLIGTSDPVMAFQSWRPPE